MSLATLSSAMNDETAAAGRAARRDPEFVTTGQELRIRNSYSAALIHNPSVGLVTLEQDA